MDEELQSGRMGRGLMGGMGGGPTPDTAKVIMLFGRVVVSRDVHVLTGRLQAGQAGGRCHPSCPGESSCSISLRQ